MDRRYNVSMVSFFKQVLDFFLHIDKNLVLIVNNFGIWSYGLLFLIIFMETGLVVTPFLPGDSLIFAAGALSAGGALNIVWLFILLVVAAFVGDTVNYWTGHFIGPKVFDPSFQFSVFSLGRTRFLRKSICIRHRRFMKNMAARRLSWPVLCRLCGPSPHSLPG